MRAARKYLVELNKQGKLPLVDRIKVDVYGSLAMTGIGHATDTAIYLGLLGETPEDIDPNSITSKVHNIKECERIRLLGEKEIAFHYKKDVPFHLGKRLPLHTNGLKFTTYTKTDEIVFSQVYYSIGGGFIVAKEEFGAPVSQETDVQIPYAYESMGDLLRLCRLHNKKIWEIILENEKVFRTEDEIREGVERLWDVMKQSIVRGCHNEGIMPGSLKLERRAPAIYKKLLKNGDFTKDPAEIMDWVSLFALAVSEENAAAGKVVTAPTNGASGIIPAVIKYYEKFISSATPDGIFRFMLTATAIGIVFKKNASISGAEVGCQGEVGVACSMAAGGLVEVLGGTNEQIENGAEIGIEHNLGLVCDPIAGLVQVPCIERNTMGAIKAVNAARLAMKGSGRHRVSLDQAVRAMKKIGDDMSSIYKETSEGGLAHFAKDDEAPHFISVNLPEC